MEDIIGKKFGLLQVIKQVERPTNRKTLGKYYLCQCDCGNTKVCDRKALVNGGVQSCGCLRAERVSAAVTVDITGQKFGRLTVLSKVDYKETKKRSEAVWLCQCECGNQVKVKGSSLRDGLTRSCGCLQKEKAREQTFKDETGNIYGLLTVVKYIGVNEKQSAIWLCKCECGNYKEVLGRDLRNGHTSSCGCMVSKGEQIISSILQKEKIKFKPQFTCETLQSNKGGFYKFDFAILNNSEEPVGMIEYNGKQHYQESIFFGKLEEIQYRDKQKEKWCCERKIPLLVIPYHIESNQIEKLVIDFINTNVRL